VDTGAQKTTFQFASVGLSLAVDNSPTVQHTGRDASGNRGEAAFN